MQKKKRTALEATVAVGRDQQDQILYLKKDAGTQIWSLERTENEPYQEPPDPVLIRFPSLFPPKAENGQAVRPSLRER